MIDQKVIAEAYQPLFDLMSKEHSLTLLAGEMDEIISAVDMVNENLTEIWRVKCDVEGCNDTSAAQGMYWKETGYWCLCSNHCSQFRAGKPQPKMKAESIEREEQRKLNPDGYLSNC